MLPVTRTSHERETGLNGLQCFIGSETFALEPGWLPPSRACFFLGRISNAYRRDGLR